MMPLPEIATIIATYSGASGVGLLPTAKSAIESFAKRDSNRNGLRAIRTRLLEERPAPGDRKSLLAVYDQICLRLVDPEFLSAITAVLEQGEAEGLGVIRRQLVDHLEVPQGGSLGRFVDLAVETLRRYAGRSQGDAASAVDVAVNLARGDVSALIREGQQTSADTLAEMDARADRRLEAARNDIIAELRAGRGAPRLLTLDWAPDWTQRALKKLGSTNPEELDWLRANVAEGKDPPHIANLIASWQQPLAGGSPELWIAVARFAEECGLWQESSVVWERLGETVEGTTRADYLVRSAVSAGVAVDVHRRDELLKQAAEADNSSVRLALERIRDTDDLESQLGVLDALETDEESLRALIASQAALTCLLLPDLGRSRHYLAVAEAADPNAIHTRSVAVNLAVQEARLALRSHRSIPLARLVAARTDALALRNQLLTSRRFEESGRLLMLAADTHVLCLELDEARALISDVESDELEAPAGAEVLGDAALRAQAPRLALELAEYAPETDGLLRIRSFARLLIGTSDDRKQAVADLDTLLTGGPQERALAAFARLTACFPPVKADWSESAETVLCASGHKSTAVGLRAMSLASRNVDDAEDYLVQFGAEPWVLELRLRVALARGAQTTLRSTASAMLLERTDANLRVTCGRALRRAGELIRARELLTSIAYDDLVPPRVRSEAFAQLMHATTAAGDWKRAARQLADWQDIRPPDLRINPWQPVVSSRSRASISSH